MVAVAAHELCAVRLCRMPGCPGEVATSGLGRYANLCRFHFERETVEQRRKVQATAMRRRSNRVESLPRVVKAAGQYATVMARLESLEERRTEVLAELRLATGALAREVARL